jgi:hypothetical protein
MSAEVLDLRCHHLVRLSSCSAYVCLLLNYSQAVQHALLLCFIVYKSAASIWPAFAKRCASHETIAIA